MAYGIVRFVVNGVEGGQTFDRYFENVDDDEVSLGDFELLDGMNMLTVEIVGTNENAIKRHMFGLDYLLAVRR